MLMDKLALTLDDTYLFVRDNLTKEERKMVFNPCYQMEPANSVVFNININRIEITLKFDNKTKETKLIKNES